MEPKHKALPVGFRFRPTDCEISKYFLTRKALEQRMRAPNVPEECHDIFSRRPRDLPGYPRETHWYFYCRKLNGQVTFNPHSIWKQIGEETGVLDPKNNDTLVGIKRPFTFVDHEEPDDILLSDKDESPQYNWFMDVFSLPLTISETDWVLCHVFRKNNEPESEEEGENEEKETVDAESLDLLIEKDGNILPPSPSPP
ncbi:hypothetical protein HID58_026310 [Brassica napus]|uniref:NAC domain-containing protein n=2 Tax=Brassica TaxID=3705 RepID=A0A3P6BII2_BRACM|nr:NAC domain-containing protein 104-like [Brassica napus]KAH0918650.1 hypothetical protein HID58_026310 [Brassica napus]CAF2167399.1 unnamed protein product [Brassica napus]CAG7902609.1 unnamed protein product [Brassica rapa]VDC98904.1 unnamed protein product [Brassica rapa]